MFNLPQIIPAIQEELFPELINKHDMVLTPQLKQLIYILEIVQVEKYCRPHYSLMMGRPSLSRQALARAFIIRYVYNLPTTECMVNILKGDRDLQKVCGYASAREVPSLSTFSRAFQEFSKTKLCDLVSDALLSSLPEDPTLTHISIDSTAIEAREKPHKAVKQSDKTMKYKRGRPKKGEKREPKPLPVIDRQRTQSLEEILAGLPKNCDIGCKKGSKGKVFFWHGYKLHCSWLDNMIPVSIIVTSASVHDSQAAIALMRMTSKKIRASFHLLDSAYDALAIREESKALGHIPIIDPNRRGGSVPEEKIMDPEQKERYKNRSNAERGFSRLKDQFGFRQLTVRGHDKVRTHLMFGVICLLAVQIVQRYIC